MNSNEPTTSNEDGKDFSINEDIPTADECSGYKIEETPPKISSQETSVVMPAYHFRDLYITLIDTHKIEVVRERIKGKSFKFGFNTQFFLKKLGSDSIIDNYIKKLGEIITIHIASPTIVILLHDDFLHRINIDFSIYTNVYIETSTDNIDGIDAEYEYIRQKFKDVLRPTVERASLHWGAMLDGQIKFFSLEEDLNDIFYSEAYPYIDIEKLNKEFNASDSPILIFLGPPGTGKTRLIRNILKYKASLNEKSEVECIFTSDQKIIEDGYIFTKFLTGDYETLILEDVDFHLTPRTDGNTSMYHLLNISNGIASNYMKEKKIILSTNLPNINNIDEALLRPGRCFDIIKTRPLTKDESLILLKLIGETSDLENKDYPISELYNIGQKTRNITIAPKRGINKKTGF